jgi:D-arabinose 5-phosphate isomerase GutQ
VTEKEASGLAKASDIVLCIRVSHEPDPFNMLATASTLAVLAAFDAVAIALMRATGYTKEQFAVNHPGGDVGRRLKEVPPCPRPSS